MNIRIVVAFFLIITVSAPFSHAEDPVNFADDDLKSAVQDALQIFWDPTPSDMAGLTKLKSRFNHISDLTGLEYAINLQDLDLRGNALTGISPILGLNSLLYLNLSENNITDLSAFSGMTQLKTLDVHGNGVSDISPLGSLTGLEELVIRDNLISGDVSELSNLINLRKLDLQENSIYDLSGLRRMDKLKELYLYYNLLTSVNTLSRLPLLETVDLRHNQISRISGLTGLIHLKKLLLEDNLLYGDAYCSDLQTIAGNNPGIILTHDFQNDPPEEVQASADPDVAAIHLTWDEVCNGASYTSYYRVYRATSPDATKTPVSSWQTSTMLQDTSVNPGTAYWYWVQTSLSDQGFNAGNYSEPVTADVVSVNPALALSSTVGGAVTLPGEGVYSYVAGQTVPVEAVSINAGLFIFTGWTGSAVEAGKVADPNAASTVVTVDSHYTLKAQFLALSNILTVDGTASDPNGMGTPEQPFDRIQDAIDVAGDGAVIQVRPGTYVENLELLSKDIQLIGMDPNSPDIASYPVIDGNDNGPVIRCAGGQGPECLLLGFTLTRGRPALDCHDSSPMLGYCLIVGNQSADPNRGAIELVKSQAMLFNCTVTDNLGGAQAAGLMLRDSSILMTNSILWGNTPIDIKVDGTGALLNSFSDIGASPDVQSGLGRINVDPLFVEPGLWSAIGPADSNLVWMGGDYHLRSQTGRWDPVVQTWLTDNVNSPGIDGGDPLSPIGLEPAPNGGIINIGAYGGTSQASLSNQN